MVMIFEFCPGPGLAPLVEVVSVACSCWVAGSLDLEKGGDGGWMREEHCDVREH